MYFRACQGVLLLVDANQGVQAQTVSNFYQAFANNLGMNKKISALKKVNFSFNDKKVTTIFLLITLNLLVINNSSYQ